MSPQESADYLPVADHFGKTHNVRNERVAICYLDAMAVSGTASLVFGRLVDRFRFAVLVVLTVRSALFAPLVFLRGFWAALIGAAVWGVEIGVPESIIPAAVAARVPAQRRASAFGLFTSGCGAFRFTGSTAIGILYDVSIARVVAFCIVSQFAAVLTFLGVGRRQQGHTAQ